MCLAQVSIDAIRRLQGIPSLEVTPLNLLETARNIIVGNLSVRTARAINVIEGHDFTRLH
jgi:hypothetical protein